MKIVEKHINSLGTIIIKVEYKRDEMRPMIKWCQEHQCGKQVAIDRFAFKEQELTMFQLRWES